MARATASEDPRLVGSSRLGGAAAHAYDEPHVLHLDRLVAYAVRRVGMPEPGDRTVLLAAPRGYCAGVDRAVITVEKALDLYGPPVYVRKQIVHNKHVVHTLESRGAIFVEELDEVPEGSTVVFSAHGVSPAVHERGRRAAASRRSTRPARWSPRCTTRPAGSPTTTTTSCSSVTRGTRRSRARRVRRRATSRWSRAPTTSRDVEVRDPSKVAWLSQTTLSVDETMETVDRIRQQFPNLLDPPSDDICYATQNRQQAVKEIAKGADLVLVVGSGNSSNSVRLVEVALESWRQGGVPRRRRVARSTSPGSTASSPSASPRVRRCPRTWSTACSTSSTERGYPAAKAVHTAEESLIFALPPELRRDLRPRQSQPERSARCGSRSTPSPSPAIPARCGVATATWPRR